ncbi:MAG TPA: PKD domain-containing protein, partial [Terriglobales bacterium]
MKRRILDLLRQGVALVLVYSTLVLTMPVRADEAPGITAKRSRQTIASLGARVRPVDWGLDLNSPPDLLGISEPLAHIASLATPFLHRSSARIAPITRLVEHSGGSTNFSILSNLRVALPRMLATLGSGSSITVFGPQQFDRTTGPPNQYSTTFTLPVGAGSPFQLTVQNGDSAGNHRVSSGWIYVNGMQIVSPSDFSQSVATISRAIALSTQNTVQITLASQPGSFITLNITGTNPPPTANAGPNQTVFTGTTVTLNGSGSTDPSGLPLTYSWVLTSRPSGSNSVLNGASTATPTFIPDTPGTYTGQLVVNNGYSSSAPSAVTITVNNSIPIANAGPPQTVYVGSTVQLDGTHSSDPAGLQLSYTWSVLSQPTGSTAVLNNTSAAAPSFTADKVGAYKFQLIVNNGYSSSAPATVGITSQNLPPVANAGPPQMVYQQAIVQLNGTSSYDPAGLPLTYQWSFVSVPSNSTATLNNPASPTPTFVADQSGNFVLQLVVNNGVFSSPPSTVTISTLNAPPVANAGPAQSATINSIVQLDGSRSTDVDGDAITYAWSFVSVPTGSNAVLSNPTTVNPSFTLDVKGDYVVQLIVNDGISDSKPSTVTISTLNSPPVASAGPNQTITVTGTVQLDGSGSTDVDGDKLTYSWSFSTLPPGSQASLSNPNSVKPTFVADVLGTYVLQLVVNDGTVNGVPAIVTITSSDVPPVANPGLAQSVNVGSIATLNGSASTDSDNQPLTYQWALLSKPAGSATALSQPTSATPYFTADVRGEYVIQLIVNDGFLSSAPVTVTVSTIDTPPVANAGANQTVNAGAIVQLSGAASADADGDPITYEWAILTQPAGGTAILSSSTVVNPSFVANVAGIYVAQLIVNDGTYNSQPVTVTITANAVNQAPIVNAGANQTSTLPANTVTLNGTATDDGLPNNTLTIAWSVVSGPGAVTFSNSSSAVTQATFSVAGTYVLQLAANDSLLSTSAATTVTVNPSLNQPPVVSAGPNQTITLPTNLVTLSGSATDDGLPNGTLSITWSQVSGPAGVIFGTPNQAVTIATFPASGTYVLQLTANDSQLSASSVVTVTVNPAPVNQPPVVSAGPNQTLTLPNTTTTLNGSATDDGLPNGTLHVLWTEVSGPTTVTFSNPTQAVTQATFNGPGLYVLQLSANDSQLTSNAQVSVYVYQQGSNGQNQPPYVNAGPDQTIVLPAPTQLNGLVIDDGLPNGTLNIAWSMLTGPGTVTFSNPNAAVTTASFSMAGTYVLTLSASDSVLTSSANVTITVGQLDGHGGYKGTDFWVMFPKNFDNCPTGTCGSSIFQPQLIITSDTSNSGTISIPGLNFSSNFAVVAGQGVSVSVPVAVAMGTIDQVENKGIHVTSQNEITLVGLSYYTFATDGYLGLPTPVLGTQYRVMAWPKTPFLGSEFGIVAPYDGTTVTITPTVDVAGHPARQPYSVTLNQGRTYQLISNGQGPSGAPPDDLTGTLITADKPIAVFGGNQCANIPADGTTFYSACNHIVEELPPTDVWGQTFFSVPIATHVKGELFRILASQDGTNVNINGTPVATLNGGEFYQTLLTTPSSINSDGPVLVAQFEPSQQFETGLSFGSPTILGDPSMFLVPPYEQFGGHYTVLTPNIGFHNYINLVAPTASTSTITVDGTAVSPPFAAISGSSYSGAQVPVTPGVHHVNGAVPFGAMLYGLNSFDSYSYQAGLAF